MRTVTRTLLAGLVALATGLPSWSRPAQEVVLDYEEMVARSRESFSSGRLARSCTDVDVSALVGDQRRPQLERLLVQVAMEPAVQSHHVALGNYYARRSLWSLAAAAYGCANGIDSKVAAVWNNLGIVYLGQDNPSAAVTALRKAVRLDRRYGLAYYNLGMAYDALEKYDAALAAYERAITLDPKLATVAHNPQAASNERQVELFLRRLARNPVALSRSLDD